MVLHCVVGFGFGELLQCVCTFKGYLYVSLFEEVSYLSDFGTVISEGGPFFVVFIVGCVHLGFTYWPPLHPRRYSWYSFLLEAESTPGAIVWPEGLCQ